MSFTIKEIAASEVQPVLPEWLDITGAVRASSICRSLIYDLIKTGKVKSVVLRKEGAARGRRLINAQSLREFISKQPSEIQSDTRKRMLQLRKLPRKTK
jgi:hypothetical protein